MDKNNAFSQNIRHRRLELGLTQAQLGELLYITPQTISKWERGESYPSIVMLPQIAKIYKCSIDDLFIEGESFLYFDKHQF